jgi:hypothetical protein
VLLGRGSRNPPSSSGCAGAGDAGRAERPTVVVPVRVAGRRADRLPRATGRPIRWSRSPCLAAAVLGRPWTAGSVGSRRGEGP